VNSNARQNKIVILVPGIRVTRLVKVKKVHCVAFSSINKKGDQVRWRSQRAATAALLIAIK
jgi:hypothetical protein